MKLDDIRFKKPEEGYAPSDDSWLLAQVLEKENVQEKKCLDMGCGSGIQTAALLLHGAAHVVCVDINPSALQTTQKMVETYFPHADVDYVAGHLFEHIKGKFDVLVFNPPYVPSDELKWMEVDGGKEGREVIDAFMSQFPKHLKENGTCFLLISSLNGIDNVQAALQKRHLKSKVAGQLKLSFEELFVLKIEWA